MLKVYKCSTESWVTMVAFLHHIAMCMCARVHVSVHYAHMCPRCVKILEPICAHGGGAQRLTEGVILSSSPCCFEADSLVEHRY